MKLLNERPGTFETNSSSSHTLVVDPGVISNADVFATFAESGVIEVAPGKYGWDQEIFDSFWDKLSYLLTATQYMGDYTPEDLKFEVEAWTGCEVKFDFSGEWYPNGYIDHQSSYLPEEYLSTPRDRFQFLFNSDSYIETDNDNH